MKSMIVAIFVAAIVVSVVAEDQPCGRGEKCLDGECCMLTGVRYGVPRCRPLSNAGGTCRPNSKPQNYTLTAGPSAQPIDYTDVYWVVCPCASGLNCNAGTCV